MGVVGVIGGTLSGVIDSTAESIFAAILVPNYIVLLVVGRSLTTEGGGRGDVRVTQGALVERWGCMGTRHDMRL